MERKHFIRLLPGIVLLPATVIPAACESLVAGKVQYPDMPPNKDQQGDIVVGDYCETCEAMYEGIPSTEKIPSAITIAGPKEPGERMILQGIVYKPDGKTPAAGIILYAWHTDATGIYSPSPGQTNGKRHGHLRNWVKTDANGQFSINSIRPASYPERTIPAHIHILVKEPRKKLYYIDEVWFDDDPLITQTMKKNAQKRGGNLTIHLSKDNNGVWQGELPITLGLNIPNYR